MEPVPKPRRAATYSNTELPPIPAPRSTQTIIRLRPQPLAERSIPPVCIDSGCIPVDSPSTSQCCNVQGTEADDMITEMMADDSYNDLQVSPHVERPKTPESPRPGVSQPSGSPRAPPEAPTSRSGSENDVSVHMEDITPDIGLVGGKKASLDGAPKIAVGPEWVIPATVSGAPEEGERYGMISPPVVTPKVPLTLLQKIIFSHPIWYMPNIDRVLTENILTYGETGNFIVRTSTMSGCMALSVRMGKDSEKKVVHFVIECSERGYVRIRQSSTPFPNLPDLLEYYTRTAGELRVALRLPRTVRECKNKAAILKLTENPWGVWEEVSSSPLDSPVSPNAPPSLINEACTSFMGPQPVALRLRTGGDPERKFNNRMHPVDSRRWNVVSPYGEQQSQPSPAQTPIPVRRMIMPVQIPTVPPQVKVTRRVPQKKSQPDRPVSHLGEMISHPEPPKQGDHPLLRNGRRSQSVRGPNPKEGVTTGHKKSFLRKFFGKEEKNNTRLADLTAFTPHVNNTMEKGYNSAFNVSEPIHQKDHEYRALMRTFKPLPGELLNVGRPLPPPPIDSAEKADRNATAVRLAKHNEGSPGPAPQMESRQPMRPPAHALDTTAHQNCIEELRRKRLQSPIQMLVPTVPKRQDSARNSGMLTRDSKKDHRLSVPNLAEPQGAVLESAKALLQKIGRNGDGELGAINEGLVTPVVRRKVFPPNHKPHETWSSETRQAADQWSLCSSEWSEYPSSISSYRGAVDSPAMSRKQSKPEKESELIWRRTKNAVPLADIATNSATPIYANRAGCVFDRPAGNWSAVNSELKARQKSTKRQSVFIPKTPTPTPMPIVLPNQVQEPVRPSEYAQLADLNVGEFVQNDMNNDDDAVSVAGTVFNEPWDSNVWENLLDLAHHGDQGTRMRRKAHVETVPEEDEHGTPVKNIEGLHADTLSPSEVEAHKEVDIESKFSTLESRRLGSRANAMSPPPNSVLSLPRAVSRFSNMDWIGSLDELPTCVPRMSPILNNRRMNREVPEPGCVIQQYVETLSTDESTIFGATLARFFECTEESGETDPTVIIRNARQFISGLKNYLMKQGEGKLHSLIDQQRNNLSAFQILSIDVILEAVLHRIVLKRMKPQLYSLMVHELTQMGSLEAITVNLPIVKEFTAKDFGFEHPDEVIIPDKAVMDEVKTAVKKMQSHYSPTKKVENLLRALGAILRVQRSRQDENFHKFHDVPPCDDVVRWFIYIISRTSCVTIEVEAWYMYELLPQQMLDQGDSTYYLTALLSAIHIFKNIEALKGLSSSNCQDMMNNIGMRASTFTGKPGDAFLKVAIPDANLGYVKYASFPGIPKMNTVKLCRVIAHSQGITNPEDFGLYLVLDGFETPMQPNEFPDTVRDKIRLTGKNFLLAYKRHDAKIAWPVQVLSGLALC